MAVEGEESAGGKLVVGGGNLSVSLRLASVVVVITLVSSSISSSLIVSAS